MVQHCFGTMRSRLGLLGAVVVVLSCFLGGCMENPPVEPGTEPSGSITTELNLVLVGQLVDVNGKAANPNQKPVDITIQGTRTDNAEGYDELELDFTLSDNYRYTISHTPTVSLSSDSRYIPLDYDVCSGFAYDKVDEEAVMMQFALDIRQGYLVLEVKEDEGTFLVASADPNRTPAEILEHFREYLEKFSYSRPDNSN